MLNQDQNMMQGSAYAGTTAVDAGLRAFMIKIYNYVAGGLALSGAVAFAVYSVPALQAIFFNPIAMMVLSIGLLVFLFTGMNPTKMMQQSLASAQIKYYIFCAVLGITLAPIFMVYSGHSVVRVFFITAAMFGGTSLLAYTTKRDLSSWRGFLMTGLIGIILAMLVNIFLKSPAVFFVVSLISVVVFTGLIAFETQQAKRIYSGDEERDGKTAIFCAFGLYINFINLFQSLLHLLGNRN